MPADRNTPFVAHNYTLYDQRQRNVAAGLRSLGDELTLINRSYDVVVRNVRMLRSLRLRRY